MCIMKDVEPFAPSLNCVLRVSSNEATKRKVASGHQPGKANRLGHRLAAPAVAASATTTTKELIRAVRDMRKMGIPVLFQTLCPGWSFTPENQTGKKGRNRMEQTAF
jgi:hypothetical protein